ncbi:putative E3 ubiquitin-protein ligase LIN-1 isoform X2 [Diospyros lotus]|uniref:putative E3 ubiquitin-protein ligase LIN-1 isoform X2 n=1 Tax=Diospyros lotus TaxID=55363 RepID=UPI0022561C30|nr:putative E3 ubiquitin-protein ligase LIN-1 isoform X2 [Diospyros lotus]
MPLLSSLRDPSLAILDRAASATMSTAATSAHIIHHATARISEILSQPDLRRRLFSAFCSKLPSSDQIILKPLKLAAETVENAMSISNPSVQSSSLRLAEKLLVSFPENPFSSFLLSLIYSLCHCPVDAAISLLDLFCIDPLLARSEIAPSVFEELFLIHLLPVLQWFNDHRSKILSPNTGYDFDDRSICDDSVVISSTRLLSQMSGDQASELTELERAYEEVLDANCRVFAEYFQEVLANTDGKCVICLPPVILEKIERVDKFENSQDEKIKSGEPGFENGRYNPMWGEGEKSVELQSRSGKSLSKFPSFCPERVSPKVLISQRSLGKSKTSQRNDFDSELDPSSADNMSDLSSSDSEAEIEVKNKTLALFDFSQAQRQKQTISAETSSPDLLMAEIDNPPGGGKHTPPKDFVCPITTHIFNDPVTLETGQTYERKAIQEWLGRGNCTCPITRQKLQSTQLPKTNYVLKRLIANWREQNPSSSPSQSENSFPESDPVFNSMVRSTSPNSVIGQAIFDGNISELRLAITNLCMSEILEESEVAVIQIEKFWRANVELEMQTMLSKPAVVNGFVEILFNSVDPRVLTATVFLLSELGSRDSAVIQTLTRVDSDVECIVALFKKGLLEAVVLIYLLRPSALSLIEMDIVDTLLTVTKKRQDEMFKMCMKPKTAALILMGQIIGSSEETSIFEIVTRMISEKAIEVIVTSMQADLAEERIAAVGILRRSMQLEGKCRNIIAEKAELAPLLESLMGAKDGEWFEIVHFLSELVKLKRTFNEQVLHIIKDEGTSSTMHTLLVYLQTALQDQSPIVAGLLLQLDLLAEPRKMSIYREEAIDTLIACLRNSDFPAVQITASETILALQGRFSSSGKSLARAYLLKRAGLDKRYKALMKKEQLSITSGEVQENLLQEEEKAAEDWERKMAYVLVSHEFGLLFEALAEGLKSRYEELCSACFVSATWLVHMLNVLPDTGIRGAARVCLLKRFVSIFKSAKDTEDRVLSMLALNSFISDADGMRDVTPYIKDILKGLRELRKSSTLAFDMLKVFSEGHDSSADLWNHKELVQEDCSSNGEVLSIFCFKDKIFSGHSDGTIKVWTGRGSILHLAQETREHTKAVTSLAILHSGDKLYSGSLDRTVRVWSISSEVMNCTQVHDMKDPINSLVVSNSISCFIPQGAGIKMHSWGGGSKLLNPNKYTKCLALFHGKLYCGCQDNSIQEVDLATGTLGTIQSGSRKLLGKANPIHALHVHDGLIYAASSPLDGAAVKIWRASNYSMVGSLPSTLEVRAMAVSSDLIYLGCKGGAVEVWCRKKYNRVETIQTGSNAKILCMALDADEDVLIIGKSDGRIQAWGLS